MTPQVALAAAPLNYLVSFGPKAESTVALTWGLLIISILVVVVMTALVIWAAFRRRTPLAHQGPEPASRDASTSRVFTWGLGITTLILAICVGWTMATLAAINQPPQKPAVTIEITGRQWWWQAHYLGDDPAKTFRTANEIHIPVGKPVEIKLRSADVIHSFWVPSLAGKMDLIPGQVNTTWIEASKPGTYVGTCAEYCGLQHAHMGLRVIADQPDAFERWRDNQLKPTQPPGSDNAANVGLAAFQRHCSACHALRGTEAAGIFGPDLSHLKSRTTLAAGTLPNDEGNLAGWIADPQHLKPGTKMPQVPLSGDELQSITTFLSNQN
jgi:cytochrome c oxidase subunit 2